MVFIDIHSHVEMCNNISKIVENMKNSNVIAITQGTDIESNRTALKLSKKYSTIKVALGIYPVDAEKMSDFEIENEIKFIKQNKGKIKAIGEVGLDLKHGKNIEKQKQILEKFVNLAKELGIPIILHSRKAEEQAIELLESIKYNNILMHCFSGKLKLVQRIVENGWYLTIPTNVKNSEHFQKVIEIVPLDQLFCETDSPFLHPDKGKYNEPSNVIESYKKIAEIKKLSLGKVEKSIYNNYTRLFKA